MLYGRDEQLAAIDRLLEGMRSGRAGSLVLRGEAGIGKTALLDAAVENATGARVLRVTGVESEAELPFAGLHALLRPVLDEVGALPERQAVALRGALGMAEAPVADRFVVGLGVLSLIAELAEHQPILCLVDDAQWVDRAAADALVFAARRLHAERAAAERAGLVRVTPAGVVFSPNGVSSALPDYRIEPDPGSVNPWQHVARRARDAGDAYTVNLQADVSPGQARVLPLAPAGTAAGTAGYIQYRVYLSSTASTCRPTETPRRRRPQ
jgi:AAA ATPase domain